MVLAHAGHLAERGHDVTIVTNKIDTTLPINPRIRIVRMPLKGKIGTLLSCLFMKQPPALLIADIIVLACVLLLRNGDKVVYYSQDYDESYYRTRALKLMIRFAYYFTLKVMKMPTIAVSEKLASRLTERFNAAVEVVSNGVDMQTFFPEPSPSLLHDKDGRKVVLLLSRKDRRKGFDLGCRVLEILSQHSESFFEVWTVGDPAERRFPGFRHRDFGYSDERKLRSLFSSADVFLFPSRHEGFGLMVMESFACRCPVVTTDAVPYAENGINALVSKIEDPYSMANNIQLLFSSEALKRTIVEQAYLLALSSTSQQAHRHFEEALFRLYSRQDLLSHACPDLTKHG